MVLSISTLLGPEMGLASTADVAAAIELWPDQKFNSTDLQCPYLEVNKTGAPLDDGYIALTYINILNKNIAPYLFDNDGQLVWQGPVSPDGNELVYGNLHSATFEGQPVLTFWEGGMMSNTGHGYGKVNIVDSSYNTLYTVCPELHVVNVLLENPECPLDIHESYLTPRGTLLATVYNITQWDLTEIGGPVDAWVVDSLFVETDVKTNEIVFVWSPLQAGVPLNKTQYPLAEWGVLPTRAWDWFHMNSVSDYLDDGYLINSRMLWGFMALDKKGEIQWYLNSVDGDDFTIPEGLTFSYAHDTRATDMTDTSLDVHFFNNANGQLPATAPSDGLSLHLDLTTMNVTVKGKYMDPNDPVAAISQGGFDGPFENGNVVLGFGSLPLVKEFTSAGDLAMSVRFSYDNMGVSYRAYKVQWEGAPSVDALSVKTDAETGKGYVSWNGDTRTTHWVVYSGGLSLSLVEKTGFETEFALPTKASSFHIAAFKGNTLLGNSTVLSI